MIRRTFTRLNHVLANAKHSYDLTGADQRALLRAETVAARSVEAPQVGACIYSDNTLLAAGYNRQGLHPFIRKYDRVTTHIHAEMGALRSVLRITARVPHADSIAVARRNKKHRPFRCSYPCDGCFGALVDHGIRRFVCYDVNDKPAVVTLDIGNDLE